MTTRVEKSIQVDAPVSTVYDQWTQFEQFPQFMGGIASVTQTTDTALHWVAEIAGVRREWDAEILEQVPDEKIAWAATTGATNAGAVYFAAVGAGQTLVRLVLEYAPEGIVEQAGDKLGVVGKQAEGDLERFKAFIEARGSETGGWRGEVAGTHVGTPDVSAAASTRGDSGRAGTSTAAKVAGVAAAAVGVAAAAALTGGGKSEQAETSPTAAPVPTPAFETVPGDPATAEAPASDISATYGRDGNQVVDALPEGAVPAAPGAVGAGAASGSTTGTGASSAPASEISATYGRDGNQAVDAYPDSGSTPGA